APQKVMSALPPKADIVACDWNVRWPKADSCSAAAGSLFDQVALTRPNPSPAVAAIPRRCRERDELAPAKVRPKRWSMFFQQAFLLTRHNDNNTEDPSSRGVDKHRLAQRSKVPQTDCL